MPGATVDALLARPYPFAKRPSAVAAADGKTVDFLRGPSEVAEAIRERRPCRLSADFGVHTVEIVEALQYPERTGQRKVLTSTFAGVPPMTWAR